MRFLTQPFWLGGSPIIIILTSLLEDLGVAWVFGFLVIPKYTKQGTPKNVHRFSRLGSDLVSSRQGQDTP